MTALPALLLPVCAYTAEQLSPSQRFPPHIGAIAVTYPVQMLNVISMPKPAIRKSNRRPRTSTRKAEQQIDTKKHQIVKPPLMTDWS